MSAWLQKQWYRLSIWHLLLIPFSWLFFLVVYLRHRAYQWGIFKSYRLRVPVLVVGNISIGGTGKTPVVIWLAEQMAVAGWRPGIISRGYGADGGQNPIAVTPVSAAVEVGDEPLLMAQRLKYPVWIAADRVKAANALLDAHPDCNIIISDDGLQHYRLRRDIEIAVVDAKRGHGNGMMLPAGPLRELPSRLKQVDAVISNGSAPDKGELYGMHLQASVFRNVLNREQIAPAENFRGQELHAIAGIGNPERFFSQLQTLGLTVHGHAFPDHHAYSLQDVQAIGAGTILMTEKDAVKCSHFANSNWWYLPVDAAMDTRLMPILLNKLKQIQQAG